MSLDFRVTARFTADGADAFEVDAELEAAAGETLVVLGPSGSGKTLLLESVGGFHPHDGHVRLDDRDLTDLPPEARDFGFVFQDYALFPHMTVRENVRFGERYHDHTRDPDELLARFGVGDLAERSPRTLSGGEKQRVALARALAVEPSALLLDEPLAALDVPTRQELRADLADALDGVTALHVTHNRTTARALGDRIAVMRDGRVVQVDDPETLFERPTSAFVARFTGANVLDGALVPPDFDAARAAIRPEHVRIDDGASDVRATVTRVAREDAAARVGLRAGDARLDAFAADPPAVGDEVAVGLPREHLAPLPADDESSE